MSDAHRHHIGKGSSVVDYVTTSLRNSFATLFSSWEAAVDRADRDPEYVHQLRISSRRAKAILETLTDFLPARKTERFLHKLDNVRKSAGPLRDADVFLLRLEKKVPIGEIRQSVREHLQRQRSADQQNF